MASERRALLLAWLLQRTRKLITEVMKLWLRQIRRCNQRGQSRWTWARMDRLSKKYLPRASRIPTQWCRGQLTSRRSIIDWQVLAVFLRIGSRKHRISSPRYLFCERRSRNWQSKACVRLLSPPSCSLWHELELCLVRVLPIGLDTAMLVWRAQ